MVVLSLLPVVAIVLAVDVVVGLVYASVDDAPTDSGLAGVARQVYIAGAVVTVILIAVVSLWNIVALAGGGAKVARMLGARKITSDTRDAVERRFLNIVEEMAIASGVRVPEAWIMDNEKGINAFAAGWTVSGAVVTVTRGALERLTRDELQGVVGHEFSHILNGDMGLNIRMIGVLAGIVAIGSIGTFLMRMGAEADDIRGAAPLIAIGLALFVIGYVGLFFARLIKSAVSRQREFLADASSVQFTRNPDGIAGALDQMRVTSGGTLIQGRYAEEMSHLFFGQGIKVHFGGLFDTHPPLDERIRRVNPGFTPSNYRPQRVTTVEAPAAATASAAGTEIGAAGRRAADLGIAWGQSPQQSATLVGTLKPEKLSYAQRLLGEIPPALRESLRTADLKPQAGTLLALMAHAGTRADATGERAGALQAALRAGAEMMAIEVPTTTDFSPGVLNAALEALKSLRPLEKAILVKGLFATVTADGTIRVVEAGLMRLVGAVLDCPLPPLLDEMDPAALAA